MSRLRLIFYFLLFAASVYAMPSKAEEYCKTIPWFSKERKKERQIQIPYGKFVSTIVDTNSRKLADLISIERFEKGYISEWTERAIKCNANIRTLNNHKIIAEYRNSKYEKHQPLLLVSGDICSSTPELVFLGNDSMRVRYGHNSGGYLLSSDFLIGNSDQLNTEHDLGSRYKDLFSGKSSLIQNNLENFNQLFPHQFYVRSNFFRKVTYSTFKIIRDRPDVVELGLAQTAQIIQKQCGKTPNKMRINGALNVFNEIITENNDGYANSYNISRESFFKVFFRGHAEFNEGEFVITADPGHDKIGDHFQNVYDGNWSQNNKNNSNNAAAWGAIAMLLGYALTAETIDELCERDPACPN